MTSSPTALLVAVGIVRALEACSTSPQTDTPSGGSQADASVDGPLADAGEDGGHSSPSEAGSIDAAQAEAGGPVPGDDHPPNPVAAKSPWTINSPDDNLVVEIDLDPQKQGLSYRITYGGKVAVESTSIGIRTSLADFGGGLAYQSGTTQSIFEHYAIPTGKTSDYVNHANELTLQFQKGNHPLTLVVRAYDDGGAYRFSLPSGGSVVVNSETGGFTVPKGSNGWAAEMAADYQGWWDSRTESDLNKGEFEFPVLIKSTNALYALLTEASVYSNYFASHVTGSQAGDGLLTLANGQNDVSVTTPFETPWRAAIVGNSLASVVESTLVENLNPPADSPNPADTQWIKPGRSAWSWWSGDSTSDYTTQTQYVDFAASMGWEYYLCDEGWDPAWMPKLVQYAAAKKVGIWLWISGDNMNTDAKIATNIALWSGWGVKGVKVDYMFGDGTTELAVYDKVAIAAAKAHLMVNYHGCTKPSGERRRWPHLMTREAIYGAEQYKGGKGPTSKFNCIVPFTRNVQGPMDYTPVTYSDTGGLTTAAHQTALDVVFESGIQHLADKPSSYQSNVAKEFLKACPSVWDETKLIEGDPGVFVTIARRSGKAWFVGSICAGAARTATIPLTFLGSGDFVAEIYEDGSSDTQQVLDTKSVTNKAVLSVPLRANGGCAIRISPK